MTVRDIDKGYKKIIKEVFSLEKEYVKIGIQAGDVSETGESLATIAAQNEFGSGKIPSRPFLSTTYDKNKKQVQEFLDTEYAKIIGNKEKATELYNKVGIWYTSLLQAEITTGNWVPNAPSTIKKKGSSKPLIDTGRLRASIRHIIERGKL